MNFAYDNGNILLHSYNEGKKIQIISRNPKVCFEVDEGEIIEADTPCSYGFNYRSVIIEGTIRVVDAFEEKLQSIQVISEKYSPGKGRLITSDDLKNSRNY
jgi:nitroimidazol reductase NimA-like FMN-containing flavoprotein (pyridoxamine 5'-phosphate oxidase superfamily)